MSTIERTARFVRSTLRSRYTAPVLGVAMLLHPDALRIVSAASPTQIPDLSPARTLIINRQDALYGNNSNDNNDSNSNRGNTNRRLAEENKQEKGKEKKEKARLASEQKNRDQKPKEDPGNRRPTPDPIKPPRPVNPIDVAIEECIAREKIKNPDSSKFDNDSANFLFKPMSVKEALLSFQRLGFKADPQSIGFYREDGSRRLTAVGLRDKGVFRAICEGKILETRYIHDAEVNGIVHATPPPGGPWR